MFRPLVSYFSAVLTFAAGASTSALGLGQETTTKKATPKSHMVVGSIDIAQVLYVSGDDAVVKLPDGRLRLLDLPVGTAFMVDGKAAKVSDLQPGSTIAHVQVSRRMESEVTTVTQINGLVAAKNGRTLTLRLEDGTSRMYTVPMHAMFMVNGQTAGYESVMRGAKISATAVKTEELSTVTDRAAMAAQTPPQAGVLLIEKQQQPH